ncbi:hypothetical protein ACS0TY_015449 [Phlomoides rotata]
MSETPFRPREKLIEKQKLFQSIKKSTHMKGRYDIITSVAIPLGFTVSSIVLIVSPFRSPYFSIFIYC